VQWGEHTAYIHTDSAILNVHFHHQSFSFVFIANNPVPLVVSHQPLTPEAWVGCQVTACGICDRQNGSETGFSLSSLVYLCHYHSTHAPYTFIFLLLMLYRLSI